MLLSSVFFSPILPLLLVCGLLVCGRIKATAMIKGTFDLLFIFSIASAGLEHPHLDQNGPEQKSGCAGPWVDKGAQ